MKVTTFGLDLAKHVFQLHWVEPETGEVRRKALKRDQMMKFFVQRAPSVVAMEACGSAHYWARKLIGLGHEVRLIAAQFVRPYVKRNKTDAADAQAIWEAVQRPYLGPVVGVYTDWTPLEGRGGLFPEDLDQEDPWQFRNVLVR